LKFDKKTFLNNCLQLYPSASFQNNTYVYNQIDRLYKIYSILFDRCTNKSEPSLLSLGAGSAFVEIMLKRSIQCRVTIIDHFEMLSHKRAVFSQWGIETICADLKGELPIKETCSFDFVLSCEVCEHLLLSPYKHISYVNPLCSKGSIIILSTPNVGRIGNVLRLLFGKAILPDARFTFDNQGFLFEDYHRREYTKEELVRAFKDNGFIPTHYYPFWPVHSFLKRNAFYLGLEYLFSSIRPLHIFIAQKQ